MSSNADIIAALRSIGRGIDDLIAALTEPGQAQEKSKDERELDLLLEFDRPDGQGLDQVSASQACRRHGFTPQTVGAWARADNLKTRDDKRYLSTNGYARLHTAGIATQHGPEADKITSS